VLRLVKTRRARIAAVGATVALAGTAGLLVNAALAAPKAPTPVITSTTPANGARTTATSATFTFTDPAKTPSFQCSLDGATAGACTSPKTYSGLAAGTHTFQVTATAAGNATSEAAARTWTIDLSAPTVAFTFPTNGGAYRPSAYAAGCASKLCGTASDPAGVSAVQVAVQDTATSKYWNGGSWVTSSTPVLLSATGTTSWSYAFSPAANGSYRVYVRATDALGNQTPAPGTTMSFVVDSTPPPVPTISSGPADVMSTPDATFQFADSASNVTFQCTLDGATSSCGPNTITYKNLDDKVRHCFTLTAADLAGNVSSPTTPWCWVISTSKSFTITGDAPGLFAPGAPAQPLDLSVTNPNSFDMKLLSVTVTVTSNTATCPSSSLQLAPSPYVSGTTFTFPNPLTLTKSSTRTLSQLGTTVSQRPALQMPDTGTNQDSCKNATFTLTYTGTASKA